MASPTNPQSDDLSFPPSPVSLSRVSGISVISKSEEFKTPEGTMEASQEQKAIDPSLSFIPDEPSMPSSSALPPSENESQNEEQPALNISHLSFATPPRISRSVVFNTPPRPDDLPDLPDLPTSPDGSLPSPTATRTPNRNTLIDGPGMTRTPHPPGGWRTPKPGRPHLVPATPQDESGVLEPNTAEEVNGSAVSVPNGARNKLRGAPTTPDAGFPAPTPEQDGGTMGASTSISKTPKPPGAWASTPVTSASNSLRKGILKVRFDETSLSSSAILEHQVMEEEQEELVTPSNKHRKGIPSAFGPNEGDVASSPPLRERQNLPAGIHLLAGGDPV
ncbi:uncharacterized protein EI90DRAFT_925651 [Cantharellus anzutake]|uniref:uncharacterized protein n=1 Tax=Cantharellus anzutake TaxID=1750568 RepID=UPI001905F6CC|nr:uncharacterized protein EI90DRAFT_925651 [Cantharellus anzutake]KAF8332106.1 hypothetical protein EI90DRAFT_925651 [Cantharellus anzutake]